MGRKLANAPQPFVYPLEPHVRRHGPFGYKNYERYRPWLRDEFSFRCVFCLAREVWAKKRANWEIDHCIPQTLAAALVLVYENLLYVCSSCNSLKSSHLVPNPCQVAFGRCLIVQVDGTIHALNEEGELLIEFLGLNDDDYIRWRQLVIGEVKSMYEAGDNEKLIMKLGYPKELDDLSKLKPVGNTKPEGINKSLYARRVRGELPEMY